jgi:hypothetical protein
VSFLLLLGVAAIRTIAAYTTFSLLKSLRSGMDASRSWVVVK